MTIHGTQAARSRQTGITLIEVMIAVLIFSIGLIGLAGLLVFATQSSHDAYLRTQATFLANSLGDRMRANPMSVWNNAYNASYPVTGTPPACSATTPCTPAQLATRDQIIWSNMLTAFLPNASANVACTTAGLAYTPNNWQARMRPPYGGTCTMSIIWSERGVADDRSAQPQTFAWVFQP